MKSIQKSIRISTDERARLLAPLCGLILLGLAGLACNMQLGGSAPLAPRTPTSGIVIVAPDNNSAIAEGAALMLAASATDSGTGVSKITFFVDGTLLAVADAPVRAGQTAFSAHVVWRAQGVQGHLITMEAARADGTVIAEAGVTVQVVAADNAAEMVIAALSGNTPIPLGTPGGPEPTPMPVPSEAVAILPTLATPATITTLAPTADPLIFPGITPSPIVLLTTPEVVAGAGTPQPSPTYIAPILRVLSEFLNVRAAPSTDGDPIGRLNQGDTARVLGRNEERSWLFVEGTNVRGWVVSSPIYVEITGDTSFIPLVTSAGAGTPTPTPILGLGPGLAPTSTISATADLVIEAWQIVPQTPRVNQTFGVIVVIRNAGGVDAPSSLLRGLFQPGGEVSLMAVPPIPAGGLVTLPPMSVTLKSAGPNQEAILELDVQGEVSEGVVGEQNNRRTLTYNVVN